MVVGGDVRDLTVQFFKGLTSPRELYATDEGKVLFGVIIGSVPTACIGLLLESQVEAWSHVLWIIGLFLLVSAVAVLSTLRGGGERKTLRPWGYFVIGVVQGLAVMPGISRSGTTISAGMLLGLKPSEAFRFSFLLSLPAVLGAVVLELAKPGALESLGMAALIAGTVALVTGYVALRVLRQVVTRGRFWAFAVYLIPMGLGLIAWDLASAQ
jgi:undecaprenyl-diphosphatase